MFLWNDENLALIQAKFCFCLAATSDLMPVIITTKHVVLDGLKIHKTSAQTKYFLYRQLSAQIVTIS